MEVGLDIHLLQIETVDFDQNEKKFCARFSVHNM